MHTDWQDSNAPTDIPTDEIHLWWTNFNVSEEDLDILRGYLTASERDRWMNFRFSLKRNQYEISRAVLRCVLSRYLDQDPASIQISTTHQGKPYLVKDTGLYFNLAHAADHAVIAVGHVKKLGVDLEEVNQDRNVENLARRVFSQLELEEYLSLPVEKRTAGFFNGWTRKEAYLKAMGVGIGASLREFAVSLAPEKPPKLIWVKGQPVEPQCWSIQHLERHPGMIGALAVRQIDIQWKEFDFKVS